jgi:YVTN family beta-propeller protein
VSGTVFVTSSVFLSATAGTVSVINGQTNTVTATLTVGTDPEAVAVSPLTGAAYVTNTGDNTVSVITFSPCTTTITGTSPG